MNIIDVFKKLGGLIKRAFAVAESNGLTDAHVDSAVVLVKQAAAQFADNDTRREWVVSALVAAGLKESLARIAVELAVQIWKAAQKKS